MGKKLKKLFNTLYDVICVIFIHLFIIKKKPHVSNRVEFSWPILYYIAV